MYRALRNETRGWRRVSSTARPLPYSTYATRLAYDGRMAYDLVKGSLFVFGFVPEEISDKFAKGREKLVLPQLLKEKADKLSTSQMKFIFRFV